MPLRGRQSEARRNDIAVLEAARDVFLAHGSEAPIAAVAERAGVGIGSLYRRYGSKTELLQSLCVLAMQQVTEAARGALADEHPWNGLVAYVRAAVALRSGALAPLAGTIPVTEEMWHTYHHGRDLADQLVARAHEHGDLRGDVTATDLAYLIEHFSKSPLDTDGSETATAVRDRLLTITLDGLRAPGATPLPEPAPQRENYEHRWTP